jgi:hypothetical protein
MERIVCQYTSKLVAGKKIIGMSKLFAERGLELNGVKIGGRLADSDWQGERPF